MIDWPLEAVVGDGCGRGMCLFPREDTRAYLFCFCEIYARLSVLVSHRVHFHLRTCRNRVTVVSVCLYQCVLECALYLPL